MLAELGLLFDVVPPVLVYILPLESIGAPLLAPLKAVPFNYLFYNLLPLVQRNGRSVRQQASPACGAARMENVSSNGYETNIYLFNAASNTLGSKEQWPRKRENKHSL